MKPYARALKREEATADLMALKTRYSVVDVNSGYQFRVNGVLDLFPTARKFHNIKTGERGGYESGPGLAAFIDSQLAKPSSRSASDSGCIFCHRPTDERRFVCSNCRKKSILQLLWS